MGYPRAFLSQDNFELAFTRITRSTHLDYKAFYRHLFQSYNLSLVENLKALRTEIAQNRYQPQSPTLVFLPKKSGVLRPLTLLTFKDLIVYQAIINVIADRMRKDQAAHANERAFGALYAGPASKFFFRSWKRGYQAYSNAVGMAFKQGYTYVADFDLVSCYELIDHNLLCASIESRVKSPELLKLLRTCLGGWTTNLGGRHLRHGLPQGPEASAFLAECVLFKFDDLKYRHVKYLRYIDDIKLMAKEEVPLRRSLVKLDLLSKECGLVPQAQKISWSKVEQLEEIVKTIPSQLVADVESGAVGSQLELYKTFTASVKKIGKRYEITDITKFKFSLNRLNPRRDVLKKIASLLNERPDCSYVFAEYLKKYPKAAVAADILLDALKKDPTYDASAANYIDTMDVCEPDPTVSRSPYRSVIRTAERRSIERSILIKIAVLVFRGRRAGPRDAERMILTEENPLVKNIVLNKLFGSGEDAPYKIADCLDLLQQGVQDTDEDYARCCAFYLLHHSANVGIPWDCPPNANPSVNALLVGLGIRTRGAKRASVLDGYFAKLELKPKIPWRKALAQDFQDAEQRCLRLQELLLNDSTAFVLMLDTFNEVLIQSFSRTHPSLTAAYSAAANTKPNPDYGTWLRTLDDTKKFTVFLSKATIIWLLDVHAARVKGDLAHAKSKKGQRTKPISFRQATVLYGRAKPAWQLLFGEWKKIL